MNALDIFAFYGLMKVAIQHFNIIFSIKRFTSLCSRRILASSSDCHSRALRFYNFQPGCFPSIAHFVEKTNKMTETVSIDQELAKLQLKVKEQVSFMRDLYYTVKFFFFYALYPKCFSKTRK